MTPFGPDCHYGSGNTFFALFKHVFMTVPCLQCDHLCAQSYSKTEKNSVTISQEPQGRTTVLLLTGMWFYPCSVYQTEYFSRMSVNINQDTRQIQPCEDEYNHHKNFKSCTIRTTYSGMYTPPQEHIVTNWKIGFIGFITLSTIQLRVAYRSCTSTDTVSEYGIYI